MKNLPIHLLLCAFLTIVSVAEAASIHISPVNLELDSRSPRTMLTLTNQATEPVLLQLEAKSWQNKNGKDVFGQTSDLIITPAVVQIPPQTKQVIRVGLKRPGMNQGKKYRLFLQEVNTYKETQTGVLTLLRFSIPVLTNPSPLSKQRH